MTVSAADLIRSGAICSLCGQRFDSFNPPTISVANGTYQGIEVYKAICSQVPFTEKHNSNCTTNLYYQKANNGVLSIKLKDLDKPPVQSCPTCNQEIH